MSSQLSQAPSPGTPQGQVASFLHVERGVAMLGSEQSLRLILQTVTTSMKHDIPEIARLLDLGEVSTANRLLHAIKGYVPVFCSDVLIEQVVSTERLSKSGSAETVRPAFALLAPQLQSLLSEVKVYLGTDDASQT